MCDIYVIYNIYIYIYPCVWEHDSTFKFKPCGEQQKNSLGVPHHHGKRDVDALKRNPTLEQFGELYRWAVKGRHANKNPKLTKT